MAQTISQLPGFRVLSRLPALQSRHGMASWQGMVQEIEDRGSELESLSDSEIRKNSLSLRFEARSGVSLEQLLPPAFALVREASRRSIGMRHYSVQLLGGTAMHFGSVAVMQTGEGKTLTATLPLYLSALTGRGAHLATANDYLAARDAKLMAPVFNRLGMSVGTVTADMPRPQRRLGYACDVTYSTAKEIGFDFLRDRLLARQLGGAAGNGFAKLMAGASSGDNAPVQRGMNFILVDEADSILIDEARTPLIVSSLPDEVARARATLFRWASEVEEQFSEEAHFKTDAESKQVSLTGAGRKMVRQLPQPAALHQMPILDIYDQLEQAIFVRENYLLDRHYVVREGEIVIVDEFTGRLAEGRKWRNGLHQAIEARENVEVSVETGEAARITIQDLFLRYDGLAGMTGTAANSARELRKIYDLQVVEVPTNRPPKRKAWPDLVLGTDAKRWQAIAEEIADVYRKGRPVLIGTRSIDKSERLSQLLSELNIPHEVLNARHLSREAAIVGEAGQVGRVTVATNMAGRGTDIQISEEARKLGGLHVICSELHDSSRIDRQLIGRCGRQGDPGTFRQFMSLDDDILESGFGKLRAAKMKRGSRQAPEQLVRLAALFRAAQRKIEKRYFRARTMLLHQEKIRQEFQREMGLDVYLDTAGS